MNIAEVIPEDCKRKKRKTWILIWGNLSYYDRK